MSNDPSVWFDGDDPRDEGEQAFLATVRQEACAWQVPGLEPQQTFARTYLLPLHLSVDVPGLSADVANLQVGYWQPQRGPYGHALEGEWGDDLVLDNHVYGRDGLSVLGLNASPQEFGAWAAAWLRDQLQRPVERREWLDDHGSVTATRYVLADTDFVLRQTGFSLIRRFRRPADRVERVR